jgi:hypothetical protein
VVATAVLVIAVLPRTVARSTVGLAQVPRRFVEALVVDRARPVAELVRAEQRTAPTRERIDRGLLAPPAPHSTPVRPDPDAVMRDMGPEHATIVHPARAAPQFAEAQVVDPEPLVARLQRAEQYTVRGRMRIDQVLLLALAPAPHSTPVGQDAVMRDVGP